MDELLKKLLSGRFIFTIVTAIVFGYSVYAGMLGKDEILAVTMLVVTFYFNKKD